MSLKSTKLLGISITTDTKETILEEIQKSLEFREKSLAKSLVIVTPNPEQIVLAQNNKDFADILNRADVAIPDGIGLVWASRLIQHSAFSIQHETIQKRTPGVELMEDLVKIAAKEGYGIGLIGGRGGVALAALERLQKKYPGLAGWSYEPGDLDSHGPDLGALGDLGTLGDLVGKIQKTNTRMVFVGLGAPKQEYLMESIRRQVSGIKQKKKNMTHDTLTLDTLFVLMSVGGSFDIIAGRTPRAPFLLRIIGFEWLWRLLSEPWRWRRQMALLKFIWLVLTES